MYKEPYQLMKHLTHLYRMECPTLINWTNPFRKGRWVVSFNFIQILKCTSLLVGRICNNFKKNRAFYDKSMKLGTWLVNNKTKKLRVSATPKMPSNGRHLVFPKWPPFFNLFIIISLFICKHHVFFS